MNPQIVSDSNSILITFIASFLIWFMFAAVFYLWVVNKKLNRNQALHAIFASLIAWAISQTIKTIFPSPRPFKLNGEPALTMTIPYDGSFPSGHSSVAFALASGVWLKDKKIGSILFVLAILVAIGRVLGNVHYFSDVIAGSMLGAATGLVLKKASFRKLLKK